MRITLLLAAAIIGALAMTVSACGNGNEEEPPGLEHDIHVHLDEWSVQPDPPSIPGPATVNIGGHNHGKYPHQITVLKTDLPPTELPIQKGAVDTETAGELVVAFDVPPADGGEGLQVATANLSVGKYAIFCNIPGHYLQGMVAAFEVTQAPASTP